MRNGLAICRGLAAAVALLSAANGLHAMPLAPAFRGQFAQGQGVDAQFIKVRDDWRGSGVLYDPETDQLGAGQPIGSFLGGSGLWGLVDWKTAHQSAPADMVEGRWSGRVAEIAFGDEEFDSLYRDSWAAVALAPLFGPGGTASTQDNWTSHFSGYIRISEAGAYNFGVLHDDGFFFNLGGAAGETRSLSNDFLNPRNRMSFSSSLLLDVGLYAFELGAYEHLEAGVVELSWTRDDGAWSRIPTSHLVATGDAASVPEPGTWAMALGGLAALGAVMSRRRGARSGSPATLLPA